jgi:hypothetical protein
VYSVAPDLYADISAPNRGVIGIKRQKYSAGKTHPKFFSTQEEYQKNMAAQFVIVVIALCASHVSVFFLKQFIWGTR